MKTSSHLWLLLLSFLSLFTSCTSQQTEVTSPNGHIRLRFLQDEQRQIYYRVDVDDTPFILPSRLGLKAWRSQSVGWICCHRRYTRPIGSTVDHALGRE